MSYRRILLSMMALVLSACTLLALLAPFLPPDKFWPPLFAAYAFLYLFFAQVILLLFWFAKPGKGMMLTIVSLLFCLPFLGQHIRLFPPKAPAEKGIVLGSLNTHSLQLLWKEKQEGKKVDREKIASLFPENRMPDILCLQEVPRRYTSDIRDWGFKKGNQHRFRNTMMISRFPMKNMGQKDFDNSGNSIIWADIQTPDGWVRVYNTHLQSHLISPETEALMAAPMAEKKTWKGYRSVLGRVRHFTAMRSAQARWLAGEIAACTLPILVAGDFNDTPQSYSYRQLTSSLFDSFRCSGRGLGTTFAGKIPGLRIDYILGSDQLDFLDHQVHRVQLSDHYPISSQFVLHK